MATTCKKCGLYKRCSLTDYNAQLRAENENLKRELLEKENRIVKMESDFLNVPDSEEELDETEQEWPNKYERLQEGAIYLHKLYQCLEDKLMEICGKDKNASSIIDLANVSEKLALVNSLFEKLTDENEDNMNIVLQFLKYTVESCSNSQTPEDAAPMIKQSEEPKIAIAPTPPTNVASSVPECAKGGGAKCRQNKLEMPPDDHVSVAKMDKVSEECRISNHCPSCTCPIIVRNLDNSRGSNQGRNVLTTKSPQQIKLIGTPPRQILSKPPLISVLERQKLLRAQMRDVKGSTHIAPPAKTCINQEQLQIPVEVKPSDSLMEEASGNSKAEDLIVGGTDTDKILANSKT